MASSTSSTSQSPADLPTLSLPEYKRYGRQMIIDGIGLEGQRKLKAASIVVVGAGGLGCPAIQYIAAAGVGKGESE
jgi:adenylyltransferase/sulfurtransferase